MLLYSCWMSSCTWRVRMALAWKRLPFDLHTVDLVAVKNPAFTAVNPQQQLPVLKDGDITVCQSLAILEYLEEAFPERPLLPKDRAQRALVRQICQMVVSGIQPLQHRRLLGRLEELGGPAARSSWAHDAIADGLAALERLLSSCAGTCSVGDNITWADCCLLPQVYAARERFGVDVSRFPIICRLATALETREEFLGTHPRRQSDCPENLRMA